jgi:hypothetical protein
VHAGVVQAPQPRLAGKLPAGETVLRSNRLHLHHMPRFRPSAPGSTCQVFEDRTGALVMCFDRSQAVLEGDLSAYMQQLAKSHWLVGRRPAHLPSQYVLGQHMSGQPLLEPTHPLPQINEYRLTKDGTHWGVEDLQTQSVFYLVWPPWVRHRLLGMSTPAESSQPHQDTATGELQLAVDAANDAQMSRAAAGSWSQPLTHRSDAMSVLDTGTNGANTARSGTLQAAC